MTSDETGRESASETVTVIASDDDPDLQTTEVVDEAMEMQMRILRAGTTAIGNARTDILADETGASANGTATVDLAVMAAEKTTIGPVGESASPSMTGGAVVVTDVKTLSPETKVAAVLLLQRRESPHPT